MPKHTLDPNGQYTMRYPAAKVAATGGTTQAVLADALDTTYIRRAQGTDNSVMADIAMATVTIPAGEKIVTLIPYLRAKLPLANNKRLSAWAGAYDPVKKTVRYAGAPEFFVTGAKTVATDLFRDRPASTGALLAWDGKEWTQSHIDNAALAIRDQHGYTDTNRATIYKAAIDVFTLKAPTVNITSPTSTISATSKPDVVVDVSAVVDQWQVDAGGYLTLCGVEVCVFTQAAAAAQGFDPATATPLASGIGYATIEGYVDGATATTETVSVVLDDDLPNSSALRIYARAWRGSDSWRHYGAWDTQDVSVALTPPATPTVTLTAYDGWVGIGIANANLTESPWSDPTYVIQRKRTGTSEWETIHTGPVADDLPSYDGLYRDWTVTRASHDYRVACNALNGSNRIQSAWATPAAVTPTTSDWWLKCETDYSINTKLERIDPEVQTSFNETAQSFMPEGAEHPVVVSGDIVGEEGSLTMRVEAADWPDVKALLRYQGSLLLDSPYGTVTRIRFVGQRSIALSGVPSKPVRIVTASYLEVD